MSTLGQIHRIHSKNKGLYLRQVTAKIEMGTALLSKFERVERIHNKEQVIDLILQY